MCGILGWISPSLKDPLEARQKAQPALSALDRRGPDDSHLECGEGWLLGHTRLSILDLTDRAKQPMTDGHGSWLVYNGEIYNFRELREELEAKGCRFRSSGDAEVLLQALCHWGPACLERLRGMFAFGWLNSRRRELILARDRYGVKPLAYEMGSHDFRFASDLFALRLLPEASRAIDSESAYLYMALGYVPAPHSILKGVRKVRPGHFLRVRWSQDGSLDVQEHQYWSIRQIPPAGSLDCRQPEEEYEKRAAEAVRYRLISDVPVGTLLSGGIDSTLVTAVCREQPLAKVPSFTMGFEDPDVDEAPFARAIADRLGDQHVEFRVREDDVLRLWDELWNVYDEPFADTSAFPMVALCRWVASHVKVALSGDGGDEVFCGYPWHRALDRLAMLKALPVALRRQLSWIAATFVPSLRYRAMVFGQADRVAQWSALRTGLSVKTSRLLPVEDADQRAPVHEYFRLWSRELDPLTDPLDWACRMDLMTYLPDDLMVKADRASMSVGLELREPLLDHQLTAWCLQLPIEERYDRHTRTAKLLPRQALAKRLPKELFDRPKQGFTPPLDQWLKGPLLAVVRDAIHRLQNGELAPLGLPRHYRDWPTCATGLDDRYQQFLWRIACFSQWKRHHEAHVVVPHTSPAAIIPGSYL